MATEVGAIKARMELDASGFTQGLQKAKQSLNESANEARRVNQDFKQITRSLYDLGLSGKEVRKVQEELRNMRPDVLEQQLKHLEAQLRRVGATDDQIAKLKAKMTEVKDETDKAENKVDALHAALTAVGAAGVLTGLVRTIKSLANEANGMANSYQGLIQVSKALNVNVEKSTGLVEELASKGFMSVAEASEAVKTALASGLNLEQTRDLIMRLGDAAAYNRQAHYGWGEAVVVTLQGIKQGNSTLTDAVGVTTNLSVMYDRYAKSIGTTQGKLTDAQKIQAAYNGFMQDGAIFAGNAATAMEGYNGKQAQFNQTIATARAELGEAFLPVLAKLIDTIMPLVKDFAAWAEEHKDVVAGMAAATVAVSGLIAVVTSLIGFIAALRVAFLTLNIAMGPIGWAIAGIAAVAIGVTAYKAAADAASESVWQFAQNQDELNKKLSESPLDRSTEDVQKLQADIDKVNELLKTRTDLEKQLSDLQNKQRGAQAAGDNGTLNNLNRQVGDVQGKLKELDGQLSQLGINTPEDAPNVLRDLKAQLDASIPALVKLEEANLRDAAASIKHIDSVTQLKKQYEQLDRQTKLSAEQKAQLTQVVKQLTQEYPGLQSQLDEEGRWHIRNTDLLGDLIQAEKDSIAATTSASKQRLEAWRAETEGKLKLAKAQVAGLMSAAGADFTETQVGSKLPGALGKAIDIAGDFVLRGVAAKAQDNANKYQLLINDIDKQISAITSGTLDKFFDTPSSPTDPDKKKGKEKKEKTAEQIQQEQYQESLKYIQYKRDLNQMSEKQELESLQRLADRYKKNGEIRMDVEVRIRKLQDQMAADAKKKAEENKKKLDEETKARFEASQEWIEQEERRMTLAGESEDEITRMKLDAWTRVRNRYAKDSDFYKQADTQVYNAKLSIMKATDKAEKDAAEAREKAAKDAVKASIDAIDKQKSAELDALDERRAAIQKFYDDQEQAIDDKERLRERNDLVAEMEKYRFATSEKGQKTFLDLQEKLRQMDIEDQKSALEDERDQKLDAIDKQKKDVESWYDDLKAATGDLTGDLTALYKLADDERLQSFISTNAKIKEEMAKLKADIASLPSAAGSQGALSVIDQMVANSQAWKTASAAERASLQEANQKLGAQLGATYNAATGRWMKNGVPLYHTGGIAGIMNFSQPDMLLPGEVAAILQQGEPVLTPKQVGSLVGSGAPQVHIERLVGVEVNEAVIEDGVDMKAYERTGGNAASEVLRKTMAGGAGG
ncbi:hypothetical protein [Cohnella sp. GbtcB17]|uniref:hypothetical protein n=1 Tax=Cohnella sp. GbtcB17 TaxID=2824762 RepID=UPI001C3112A2|nr:hypothetical protein [Cohnella sp. GbtcB17]